MVRKSPAVDNNNASLIWSIVAKTNCYRKCQKYPKLNMSLDPASIKNLNRRSQVGFIQKKQMLIENKKDKMVIIRKTQFPSGRMVKQAVSATGPRKANRLAYQTGKSFLHNKPMAKAARVKACVKFCSQNKVNKRGKKSASG